MNALSLTIQKLWPVLKFYTNKQMDRQINRQGEYNMPQSIDVGHKKGNRVDLGLDWMSVQPVLARKGCLI